MSLKAWGDEGNVPSRWEETAMRQEFDAICFKWSECRRRFKDEIDGPDLERVLNAVSDALEEAGLGMEGPL